MTIEPGQQLLHYRLVGKIGEGGMGVVWKAVDADLGREVAIKVLPPAFAADSDRLARFEREARLLASLNHPGIAAVYGLHESDGTRFLAMELVEGEDLGVRLSRGSLPIDDALELAGQVCEALEAAHDAGVIHRDLKPANVMLTPAGKVKVLDFGLAKALTGEPASGSEAGASLSPTMTSAGTRAGMILGTAAYMSPEQARGKPVDRRADIWALGCMLFEMLTGRSIFGGETVTDTLAAVVRAEPDWSALPAATPVPVRRALRRCLQKDPARRLRDAGDVRLEIEEARGGGEPAETEGVPASTASTRFGRGAGILWALAGAVLALIVAWAWPAPSGPAGAAGGPVRFEVVGATGEARIDPDSLAMAPDGRRIAWVVVEGARRTIHVRELDELASRPLPDTDGASRPVFSPDGRSIAFYAQGKLRRIDLGSRTAVDLCDTDSGAGIAWGPDGTIVYADGWNSPLSRVTAAGGECGPATRLDPQDGEIGHWFADLLPDGRHVLVSRWRTTLRDMSVAVAPIDGGQARDLVPRASFARFVPPGTILFARAGAIYTVPFDPDGLEVTGPPVLLVDGVEQEWSAGSSPWTVSDNGVLAFFPGGLWSTKRTIVRVSRQGAETPMEIEPGAHLVVAMSPDGRLLARAQFENGDTKVVIHDLARGIDTPLPVDAVSTWPVWSPDASAIAFTTALNGPWDVYRYAVDGGSEPEALVQGVPDQMSMAWSPDGRFLLWEENSKIHMKDLRGGGTPTVLVSDGSPNGATFSPDSRWLAYSAMVSGRREVLVRRFPDGVRDYRVSMDGGEFPLWSRDGRELLYRRGDALLATTIRVAGESIDADRPRVLFRGNYVATSGDQRAWSYDPTTDEAILIRKGDHEISGDRFVVVIGWPDEFPE